MILFDNCVIIRPNSNAHNDSLVFPYHFPEKNLYSAAMWSYLFNGLLVTSGSALGLRVGSKINDNVKEKVFGLLGCENQGLHAYVRWI